MSKDEALQKWLDERNLQGAQGGAAYVARAAWHAAVKHTLAYVAREVNKRANIRAYGDHATHAARTMRNLADDIAKMKP